MTPKKSKPSQADINTFHEAVKGVKPLIHNKTRLAPPASTRRQIKRPSFKEDYLHFSESGETTPSVLGEEFISYKQTSISNKILRKLRKGQYNIEARLDLHGMNITAAKAAVSDFLQECLQKEIRAGLIIHGKGLHSDMPILKNKLNQWLRSAKIVLAFCSAAPNEGGRGATYVLLKHAVKESVD
jgi:DNA-nicking Smr family endonuclease